MKKNLLIFILFLCSISLCPAQEELPTVVPDRPGYSWGAAVVQHKKLNWDNGFSFETTPDGEHTITLNSTVLRYGLFENLELRIGTDFMLYNDGQVTEHTFCVAPLNIGAKIKLYESNGILPSVGVMAEVKSKHIGTKDQLPSHLAPSLYVLFDHNIADRFWICYNAGLEWDGESASPTTFLALAFGVNFTDSFGAFLESYNYLNNEEGNQYMTEFGVTWLVSRRVQLDLEGDLDFQRIGKYYSIGCGVSWLIN